MKYIRQYCQIYTIQSVIYKDLYQQGNWQKTGYSRTNLGALRGYVMYYREDYGSVLLICGN